MTTILTKNQALLATNLFSLNIYHNKLLMLLKIEQLTSLGIEDRNTALQIEIARGNELPKHAVELTIKLRMAIKKTMDESEYVDRENTHAKSCGYVVFKKLRWKNLRTQNHADIVIWYVIW